jgi:XTP/dITP diphosphohydrolase
MALEIWIATTNKDKLRELKELMTGMPFEVHAALELPHYTAPAEVGSTFAENSRIKARFLKAMKPDAWVMADDSGIEVDALGGLPGVHSARFAGPKARDIENTLKVLNQLAVRAAGDKRQARFKCALCLLSPTGEEKLFEGVLEGTIAREPKGKAGFGYDPIFVPVGETKTISELGLAVKNRLSHRAQAFRAAKAFLAGL